MVEPETAREVRKMMEGVISDVGTAKNASIPGYRVAGKTGTANRPDRDLPLLQGLHGQFHRHRARRRSATGRGGRRAGSQGAIHGFGQRCAGLPSRHDGGAEFAGHPAHGC